MRWFIVVVLGAGLGLLAALGDADRSTVIHQAYLAEAVTVATHLGTTYAAAAVLGGALLAKRGLGVLAGPVVLVAAVVAYTGWVEFFVDHRQLSVDSLTGVFTIYLLAAFMIGPFLGLVGQLTRDAGPVGTLCRAAVPVALIGEVAARFPVHRAMYQLDPTRAWTLTGAILIGVLGFVAAGLSHRATGRH